MSYGGTTYAGGSYSGAGMVAADIPVDTAPTLAVEVSLTTGALEDPVWVDITPDVRSWNTLRGRNRELERFQPGRATVVLSNLQRQYDSSLATGPWFGNLRPMRRMRIRETFNGTTFPVFDGYVDKWHLDYPGTGKDATATIVATDGFKVFARTDLPMSVYAHEVQTDAPDVWYRLRDGLEGIDELLVAANSGAVGTTADGTYAGSPFPAEGLIVNDPGPSLANEVRTVFPMGTGQAIGLPFSAFNIAASGSFAIEMWARPQSDETGQIPYLIEIEEAGIGGAPGGLSRLQADLSAYDFRWPNTSGAYFSVTTPTGVAAANQKDHIVAKLGPDKVVSLWVNGIQYVGTTMTGTPENVDISFMGLAGHVPFNWGGEAAEIAIYRSATAVDPLPAARIAAHYAAGTHPWQGDTAAARLDRVLDVIGWPATLREFDAGMTTLQSATLDTPAIEHLDKVAETELGLLFMNRTGSVRFVSFANQGINTPYVPQVIGDAAGEVGYTAIVFEDGDEVIRNRATISRYNGVAKTDEDAASVDEFGRFDFVLDGLLHDSDAYSADYAAFVVAEYAAPRRRVSSITLGSPPAGEEAIAYPMILGRELGEHITVRNRPPGGGSTFEQTAVIEGIEMTGTPDQLSVTFSLSPLIIGTL